MTACFWQTKPALQIDESLLIECEEMERIVDASMGGLLQADIVLAGQYAECQERHSGLVKAIREQS